MQRCWLRFLAAESQAWTTKCGSMTVSKYSGHNNYQPTRWMPHPASKLSKLFTQKSLKGRNPISTQDRMIRKNPIILLRLSISIPTPPHALQLRRPVAVQGHLSDVLATEAEEVLQPISFSGSRLLSEKGRDGGGGRRRWHGGILS